MADIDVNQIIAAAQGQAGGASTSVEDQPIVPLWRVRPRFPGKGGAGSSAAADHSLPVSGAGSSAAADRYITDPPQGFTMPDSSTMAAAEGHWMDMSDKEKMEFAAEAEKAGLWKKSLGGDALFGAWAKAVGWAGKYNSLHKDDKSKWMSPWEAVTKMQIAGMADDGQDHDGFSTQTQVQQFSTAQLQGQARQVLQSELGRNPTDSEMKAYTAAINAAARANPQMLTQQQTKNSDGSTSTSSVSTGGIDPNEIIRGMVDNTDESDAYTTATQYLPALQQAIGAAIHM